MNEFVDARAKTLQPKNCCIWAAIVGFFEMCGWLGSGHPCFYIPTYATVDERREFRTYSSITFFMIFFWSHIPRGTKPGGAPGARAPPIILKFALSNRLCTTNFLKPYRVSAPPIFKAVWRPCIYLFKYL